MTDFYPAAISGETALQGSMICDSWFDATEWSPSCAALAGRDAEMFATAASEVLYIASGWRWPGICSIDVRPCPGACGCWLAGDYCDTCQLPCDTARLPSPVHQLVSVTIDGAAIDAASYRLINGEYLQRLDAAWPYQNYRVPPGQAGSWSVSLKYGAVPPILGVVAAKTLACWFAESDPAVDCALPAHVVSLTRQGVNQQFDPNMSAGFALPAVEMFLRSYGVATADVWSPDLAQLPSEVL